MCGRQSLEVERKEEGKSRRFRNTTVVKILGRVCIFLDEKKKKKKAKRRRIIYPSGEFHSQNLKAFVHNYKWCLGLHKERSKSNCEPNKILVKLCFVELL